MERIKEALDKVARDKRTLPPGQGRALKAPAVVSEERQLSSRRARAVPNDKARRVKLDPSHLEENCIVAHRKSDPNCHYFDNLRTQVVQSMDENGWRTLAVTSPTPQCGKTVVATNLAISIAQQPERTCILVDFDLRVPNVGKVLGLKIDRSLADYFHGTAAIEEFITNPELPGFLVLPTHMPLMNASEILASKATTDLIADLRSRHPDAIIIFDLPPMLAHDDVLAVVPKIDCVMLIAAAHKTRIPEIAEAERLLEKTNYLGLVLNQSDEPIRHAYDYRYR